MLKYTVHFTKECNKVEKALCEIDKKISEVTSSLYNEKAFLSKKKYNNIQILTLLHFKDILYKLYWNNSFYNVELKQILTKVKNYINAL